MDIQDFLVVIAGSVVANALCLIFIYALWRATQHEKRHGDLSSLPWPVLLAGIAAPLAGGAAIWFGVIHP